MGRRRGTTGCTLPDALAALAVRFDDNWMLEERVERHGIKLPFQQIIIGIVSRDLIHVIRFRLSFPNIVVLKNVSLKNNCVVITDEN